MAASTGCRLQVKYIQHLIMNSRYLTAAFGIPLVLAVVWLGGWLIAAVVAVLALLALWEMDAACRRAGTPLVLFIAYPALVAILYFSWKFAHAGDRSHAAAIWVWVLPAALLVAAVLAFGARGKVTLHSVALTQLAVLYVGLFAFMILLHGFPGGGWHLFWIMLLGVWTSDTAAYFAGRKFGKKPLTSLSPGKTREGFAAGILATTIVCIGLALAFKFHFVHAMAIGVLVALAAPLGDLVESFWKRELGAKDMGTLLPGHGGVLDRCDSLLFTSLAVYLYAFWQL